jgi:hypothetical protein
MKLDLTKKLEELDGTKTADTLARVCAQMLKSSPRGDALQYLDWALELWRTGVIEGLTESQAAEIMSVVQGAQAWALARGQIIREIKAQIARNQTVIPASSS